MTRFYNDEELSKIKELEKGILKDFIELCEENNLRYFGMGGTCLGAVRHGGYIPWDDDIDVGMPRKDYNRLLKRRKNIPTNIICLMRMSSAHIRLCQQDGALRIQNLLSMLL